MDSHCYKEYRCTECKKLLFRGILIESEIEIKCKGCRQLIVLHGAPAPECRCDKAQCQNCVPVETVK